MVKITNNLENSNAIIVEIADLKNLNRDDIINIRVIGCGMYGKTFDVNYEGFALPVLAKIAACHNYTAQTEEEFNNHVSGTSTAPQSYMIKLVNDIIEYNGDGCDYISCVLVELL